MLPFEQQELQGQHKEQLVLTWDLDWYSLHPIFRYYYCPVRIPDLEPTDRFG